MSKKDHWYRQCTYETQTEQGKKVDVSWIPETLAKVGKKIYFGKKTDSPGELWEITSVGERHFWVNDNKNYKHQRKTFNEENLNDGTI